VCTRARQQHRHTHIYGVTQSSAIYVKSASFFRLWVEVNLLFLSSASQVELNNTWPVLMGYHCASVCTFLCLCMPALWWCPQAPGFDAGKSTDRPLLLSGPISLFAFSQGVLSMLSCSSSFTLFSSRMCCSLPSSSPPSLLLLVVYTFSKTNKQRNTEWQKDGPVASTPTYSLKQHKHSIYKQAFEKVSSFY